MLLTPEWLATFEDNMTLVSEQAYDGLAARLWYQVMTKRRTSDTKRERLSWMLDTAQITTLERGEMNFEQLMSHQHEFEHDFAGRGLMLHRSEFEDKDANGINAATEWSRQIGAYMAWWPQMRVAQTLLANPNAYDGVPFFSDAHHVNPYLGAGAGTYSNDLSGYDLTAGTVDAAVQVLANALAYVRGGIPVPNGQAPRNLVPKAIVHPPMAAARIQQLTSAQYIAQAASSGGGSGDISAVVRKFGLGEPVEAPELGAAFGGSDSTCYLVCTDVVNSDIGGLIYSVREDFQVLYNNDVDTPEFARTGWLQWLVRGRNTVTTGHPFAIFRLRAA